MLRGKQRHSKQRGMVATDSTVVTCAECKALVGIDDVYEGWCFPCVLRWGHPDDAEAVRVIAHGWTREAVTAALLATQAQPATPIAVAVQTVGETEWVDRRKAVANLNIESATMVAGDGFLYNDDPSTGRWSVEVRAHFVKALEGLFRKGLSIRAIARATGISRITIRYYRHRLRDTVAPCECGQPATHQSWCRPRFLASLRRQEFMQRWHPSRSWPYVPKDAFQIAWANHLTDGNPAGTEQGHLSPSASAAP